VHQVSPDIALWVNNLRKTYKDVVAVKSVDLEVRRGECFALLGPNGAGKTTTLEVCEGLTKPDRGDVVVLGMRWAKNARELRQRIGLQLQATQFADKLSVIETARLFRSFFRKGPQPDDMIAMVQLETKREAWVRDLSGGQKQRLALACALAGDPDLLFLDEPTSGLDPQSRRSLWDLIRRLKGAGRTILLTTHYMSEAEELCDQVAIMDGGTIIARGSPRELTASVGGEHIIELTAAPGSAPIAGARLQSLPGVEGLSEEAGSVRLKVREPHLTAPAVLEALNRHGVLVSRFETHSATLEDVYVALTGRQVRDG